MSEPILKVANVETYYGPIMAIRGVSFEVAEGSIVTARIVPPTAQNQPAIEADLMDIATRRIDADDDTLQLACEAAVRNHDPCISCATHFLKLNVTRR